MVTVGTRLGGGCFILLMLLLASCKTAPTPTSVLVVIDSELEVGEELRRLEVQAFDRELKRALMDSYRVDFDEDTQTLPLSFALLAAHQDERGSFRVVVTGYGGEASDGSEKALVEQQVIGHFEPGRALRLDIFLSRTCYGADKLCRAGAGPGEQTCDPTIGGACGDIPVRTDLPTVAGDELGGYSRVMPDGVQDASDINRDASAEAGATNAGQSDRNGDVDEGGPGDAAMDAAEPPPADAGNDAAVDDVNDCVEHACKNGSACVDGLGHYSCNCGDSGYTGEHCDEDINECDGDNVCSGTSEWGATFSYHCRNTRPHYSCEGLFPNWKIVEPPVRFSKIDKVIADHMTGLEWLEPTDIAFIEERTFFGVTWQQAKQYCASSSIRGGGWRLPSRAELMSTFDYSKDPEYDNDFFPYSRLSNSQTGVIWTASKYAHTNKESLRISSFFSGGDTGIWVVLPIGEGPLVYSASSGTGIVQCVR